MNTKAVGAHTPGPWTATESGGLLFVIDAGDYDHKADTGFFVGTVTDGGKEEHAANARLIAAAPDLLEALESLVSSEWMVTHSWGGDRDAVMAKARAAIAKARGEQA